VILQISMAAVLRARLSRGAFARALSERFVGWFSTTSAAPLTVMKDTGFLDVRMTAMSPPDVSDPGPHEPMQAVYEPIQAAYWSRRSVNATVVAA